MGERLIQIYQTVRERGGIEAQIKLAMITRMSSIKAREVEDTEEYLKIFENAKEKILSELLKKNTPA